MGMWRGLPYQGTPTKEPEERKPDNALCLTCGVVWENHLTKKGDRVLAKYRGHVRSGSTVNRQRRRAAMLSSERKRRQEVRSRAKVHTMHWRRRDELTRTFEGSTEN